MLLLGMQLQPTCHAFKNIQHRNAIHLQAHPEIDAPQIEQVVDEFCHVIHALHDHFCVALLLFIQLAGHFQHSGITTHQRQR